MRKDTERGIMSKVEEPVIIVTDDGAISWTPLRERNDEQYDEDDASIVNGGWLLGPRHLVDEVQYILNPEYGPEYVPVVWSTYEFSPQRDQVEDVVAAMYDAANGRGIMNDKGWEIIHSAMPELTAPENNQPGVIY